MVKVKKSFNPNFLPLECFCNVEVAKKYGKLGERPIGLFPKSLFTVWARIALTLSSVYRARHKKRTPKKTERITCGQFRFESRPSKKKPLTVWDVFSKLASRYIQPFMQKLSFIIPPIFYLIRWDLKAFKSCQETWELPYCFSTYFARKKAREISINLKCRADPYGQHTANRWYCTKRTITNCSGELSARYDQANKLAQRAM